MRTLIALRGRGVTSMYGVPAFHSTIEAVPTATRGS